MTDKNIPLLNKVKNSFEEILAFSKFFEFESYNYFKLRILSYKKNNIWIIEYMRLDFSLEPIDQMRNQISKEENALYIQFSKEITDLLNILAVDNNGVYIKFEDKHIYFDNRVNSISQARIINQLKNYHPYPFKESRVKLKFHYMQTLYSSYRLNEFKYQRENFYDLNTGLINTGEDIFTDFMEMGDRLLPYSFIIFVFPIYSFSISHKIIKEKDKKTIVFEKKIPTEFQDSLEIYYQLNEENKRNLKKKIIIPDNFSGNITILINWYGNEEFIPKGILLYQENIIVEKTMKEDGKFPVKTEKDFIEIDFFNYRLPSYDGIKNLINLCAEDPEFYKLIPNLVRNLFENLLGDIFSACLVGEYKYLYYNSSHSRVREFSRLIDLLKTLKGEIESLYVMNIHKKIFEYLGKFRKDGNYSIHHIQEVIESDYAEKNQEKFSITLNNLLQLYQKIINSKKKIEKINPNLLENFGEKQSTKKRQKKVNDSQIAEITQLISTIRSDFKKQIIKTTLGSRISIPVKEEIQKKINNLTAKVIKLRLENLGYKTLVQSITILDSEFNAEFLHKKFLLYIIGQVAENFKFAISDVYTTGENISNENDASLISKLKIIIFILGFSVIIMLISFILLNI